jgi:probable phosphoglycerate mutase
MVELSTRKKLMSDLQLYIFRHGETTWSLSGQHTGVTDLHLTENGKRQAKSLAVHRGSIPFAGSFSSPRLRALETAHLAGFHDVAIDPDLQEWNYGKYEGLTSAKINEIDPHWNLFKDGAPGGESPSEVRARADRILSKLRPRHGNIALFSHGHFSRVLAARWLGLDVSAGRFFFLSPASMSILGFEHDEPVIHRWNG